MQIFTNLLCQRGHRVFKKISLVMVTCIIAISITACGGSSSTNSPQTAIDREQLVMNSGGISSNSANAATIEGSQSPDTKISNVSNRKIITTARFDLQTKDYDKTMSSIDAKIAETNSFIEHSSTHGDKTKGNASAQLNIRVPVDKYNDFKSSIPQLGNVTSTSEGGTDVTAEYFDTEVRLTVLRAQEKRILELLEKASIEEIIQIEDKLSQLRIEIEQLTTVIKRYDDLTSYATITISIQQTNDYINVAKNNSFWSKVGEAFSGSVKLAFDVAQNVIILAIWLIPYILVASIILTICLIANKKRIKSIKQRIDQQPNPVSTQIVKKNDDTTHTS